MAHDPRGSREEVRTILPVGVIYVHQLEVSLMDERGGIEGVIGSLGAESLMSHQPQLVVDQRHEVVESLATPVSHLL